MKGKGKLLFTGWTEKKDLGLQVGRMRTRAYRLEGEQGFTGWKEEEN